MSTKIFDVYITEKPLFEVFQMMADFHVKHKDTTYPETIDQWFSSSTEPLEVSVVIIPLSKRRTIVKPFYSDLEKSQPAIELKELLSGEGFSDYHYQNQSDRPDDVSPQEWNARKMNWDRVSDRYGLKFSDMGMSYTVWRPSEVKIRKYNR